MSTVRSAILCICILFLFGCRAPMAPPQEGFAILQKIASSIGFTLLTPTRYEQSFLQTVQSIGLKSTILMQDDDRLASAFWVETSSPVQLMNTLTELSFKSFSASMENLVDDTLAMEGYRPVDVLAFTDPVLSSERIMIVQIGETVYEFHYPPDREPVVQGLLLELARL